MRIKRANRAKKRSSEASFTVYGPDSALDSEVMAEVMASAREDCAYHRAFPCQIGSTSVMVTNEFPNISTTVIINCLAQCGRIVSSACHNAEQFLGEVFEGRPVQVSKDGKLRGLSQQ